MSHSNAKTITNFTVLLERLGLYSEMEEWLLWSDLIDGYWDGGDYAP